MILDTFNNDIFKKEQNQLSNDIPNFLFNLVYFEN